MVIGIIGLLFGIVVILVRELYFGLLFIKKVKILLN